jgi:hypothetical protein
MKGASMSIRFELNGPTGLTFLHTEPGGLPFDVSLITKIAGLPDENLFSEMREALSEEFKGQLLASLLKNAKDIHQAAVEWVEEQKKAGN